MVLVVVMSKSFMTITSKLVMMNCCGCDSLKNHSFGRFSFCATPVNETALMVLGGWGEKGALDSVQVGYHGIVIMFSLSHTVPLQCSLGHLHFVQILDLKSGRWEDGPSLPSPRCRRLIIILSSILSTPPRTPPPKSNKSNRQTSRYGHTCLLTEVAGTRGIMVAGGALAGKQVAVIAMMMIMMALLVTMITVVTLTIMRGVQKGSWSMLKN